MAKPHRKLPELSTQDIQRFWSKVAVGPIDECWLWLGAKDEDGYGLFKIKGKMYRASRVMYKMHHGEDPGPMLVCHHCDNPPCMNPADFFLGTTRDNKLDCKAKGRMNTASGDNNGSRTRPDRLQRGDNHHSRRHPELLKRGEDNPSTVLTKEQVLTIRARHSSGQCSMSATAREYNVCPETIRMIVHRVSWKHI